MSAASVMMFSSMPIMYIMATLTKVLSGMVIEATMAERMGKSTIMTMMMMAIDTSRSRRKELTLRATTLGLSAIRVMVTSEGSSSAAKLLSTRSTSLPYSTTLLPATISIDSNTQGCPSCSMRLAGWSYSRTTRATSLTRATLPVAVSLKIIWLAISSSLCSVTSTCMGTCWSSSCMSPLMVVMPCACSREKSICCPMP